MLSDSRIQSFGFKRIDASKELQAWLLEIGDTRLVLVNELGKAMYQLYTQSESCQYFTRLAENEVWRGSLVDSRALTRILLRYGNNLLSGAPDRSRFRQQTPSSVWQISHELNEPVGVKVFPDSGRALFILGLSVDEDGVSKCLIAFSQKTAGYAELYSL